MYEQTRLASTCGNESVVRERERVEMSLYSVNQEPSHIKSLLVGKKISAAEIGTIPQQVDDFLHKVFRLSRKWKVLLLLNEANVFLEQRNTENLLCYYIMSVFLRRLEYFKGNLIFTINRVDNFDVAILNRNHIKLNYPKISPSSRKQIWANNLRSSCEDSLYLTAKEVARLVEAPVNGRQVCRMSMYGDEQIQPLTRDADQEHCVHRSGDG